MKRRFLLIIFLISIIYFLSASSIYATDIDAQYNSNELSIESPNLNINTKDIDCESLNSNVYSNNNIDNSNLENSDDQPQIASNSMEADDFDHVSLNSNNKIDDSDLESIESISVNGKPQIASISDDNQSTIIEADNFEIYFKNGTAFEATLLDNNGNPIPNQTINLQIAGVNYERVSDLNGTIRFSINLNPGTYNLTISFTGNETYLPCQTMVTVTVLSTISGDDVVKYYRNGTQYYASFLDNDGRVLSNTNVTFNINGVFYTRTTDENGTAMLSINLNPASYIITAINPINNESYSNNITVLSTISGGNVVKYYRNGTQYYASFLDNDGRVLSNTNVTFNINGVFYTRTTDENGTAMLSINLNPASYIITAINPINNESYSNNITVLPTIYGSDIVMYYRNGTQYYASFLDNEGRALSNTNVTFNINGVFYTRTTDENGTAALSINLNPAVYIITAINPINNEQYSNTITVLANETTTTNGNGYWVQGKDMNNVNLASLASQGVGNIFLNFYAFTLYGESAVLQWIDQANKNNIKVHIWVQSFYDGGWNSPVLSDGTPNYSLFNKKIDEIKYYAALKGVKGIHLDYLRFPGTAYKHTGGTEAINTFVKSVSEAVRAINPNLILSAAVMPEKSSDPYYYGQDVTVLGKYLDVIVPMVYKGNYNAGSSWITSTTKWFVENSQGAQIWTGLQTYNSDSDISRLSLSALTTDAQAAINGGATGAMMFRYGVCNFINFNNLNYPNNSKITTTTSVTNRAISMSDIQNAASTLKQNIEKNGILPSSVSSNENTFTIPQLLYLMSQYVDNFGSNMTFDIMSLSSPSNSTGDILYGEVFKSEYSSMAESLINYIKSNNKAPDYMNSSLGKINYDNLVYTFSKLVDYMSKYGIAPEYVYVASYLNYPSLTVTMLPSNSNEYDHIYYTTTWLNYCPNCGYYGSLLINPKGTVEGELTCAFCDSDYCGVSGNEKVSNPFSVLTRISDSQPSNTSNPSSANGNSQGSVNNIPSSISLNSILNAAVNLKSYIENHDDLPDRVSIDNFDVSLSQFLYLMCVAVKNIYNSNFNNINWVNVSSTVDPSGSTISARLLKDDYYDVAVRVANFILEYNRAPNYASSTVGNIIYDELIDAFSRVLAYYKNNNALPNYVQISTSASQMISSLVKSLTNGITTDYGKAEALFNWVRDKISYQFYYNTQKGADLTLSSRAGNCCDQAQLLVAMARSAGLTIRFATGNCRFSSGSVYGHVWTQFYLNGKWVIADPTSSRNSLGSVKNWNTNTYTSKGTYDVLPY